MKFIFKVKKVISIRDKNLILEFRENSFKSGGFLWKNFQDARQSPFAKVCFCRQKTGDFVGWGLLDRELVGDIPYLMLFVKKEYRRLGIGTKIIKLHCQNHKEITVYPHSIASNKFFKSIKNKNLNLN